jgi:tRNA-modifying protein YgfZ
MLMRHGASRTMVLLEGRSVILVSGEEAGGFLDRILTNTVSDLEKDGARYAALLTPQGKVVADMLVAHWGDAAEAYVLIVAEAIASELVQRMNLFKLRARVAITDESADYCIAAKCGIEEVPAPRFRPQHAIGGYTQRAGHHLKGVFQITDPRVLSGAESDRIVLMVFERDQAPPPNDVDLAQYFAHCIALGIPHGGLDFAYGDVFPHEINMDMLRGINFQKGCYVGQEVVSRMQHRGAARTRIMSIVYDGGFGPEAGTDVIAGGKVIGSTGFSLAGHGLGMIRLDRLADAFDAHENITAGGISVRISAPPYAPDWLPVRP